MRRYIGKIKRPVQEDWRSRLGELRVNNPHPFKKDGTSDDYHNGLLIWHDLETGNYYHVKNMSVASIPEEHQRFEFTESVYIELDAEYMVKKLEK